MEFKMTATFTIENEEVLGFVNDFQDSQDLEEFDFLEEVPQELILVALDFYDEFAFQLQDIYSEDLTVTINEKN